MNITKRQKQVLDFIVSFKGRKAYAPSLEEIKKHLKLSSVSTAHHHVKALQSGGYLKKEENHPRAIDVFEKAQLIKIPLLGIVAAGEPIEAIENKEYIAIPRTKLQDGKKYYALRVKGQSMVDENIQDGDLIVVKSQSVAENGQKVVALINNTDVTLKKIYFEKSKIRLQPSNKDFQPIYVRPSNLKIAGIVIDVIKNITIKEAEAENQFINNAKETGSPRIEPNQIVCGDTIKLLDQIEPNSVHLVLSDIPYGISLDEWDVLHANTNSALLGQSPAQIGKNAFKRRGKPINGWSSADKNIPREYQDWCYSWAHKLFPLMKEGASLFIFGARRTMHRALVAFEESGFLVRDVLSWEKPSAHHRAQALSGIMEKRGLKKEADDWSGWRLGNLAPKYEPVAWLFKPYQLTITDNVLKNGVGAMNIDACLVDGKSPTNILKFGFESNEGGLHEAQKPVALLEYLIRLTTREGQVVLDPFIGSGSTIVAAKKLDRKYIGFDISQNYCTVAKNRLATTQSIQQKRVLQEALF